MLCSLRPRMVCFAALCAIAAMGTIACGPNANNGDGGGSITPNEMEERLVQLIGDTQCERFYQCPEEQRPGEVLFASRFGSEQACKNNIQTLFGTEFESTLQRDIDAGLSEFDGGRKLWSALKPSRTRPRGPVPTLASSSMWNQKPVSRHSKARNRSGLPAMVTITARVAIATLAPRPPRYAGAASVARTSPKRCYSTRGRTVAPWMGSATRPRISRVTQRRTNRA